MNNKKPAQGAVSAAVAPAAASVLASTEEFNATFGTPVAKKSTTRGPMDRTHDKYALYLRSLPAALREHADKNDMDPRALYKEYRELGAKKLVEKHLPKAAATN